MEGLKIVLNLKKLREVPGRVAVIDEFYDSVVVPQGRLAFSVQGQAVQRGWTVFVDLRIKVTVIQACSRCLAEVVSNFELEEHLEFQPESENLLEMEAFTYDMREAELDLRPYVIALIASALDPKPLCRPDCKGLCPTCGQNLNLKQCSCARQREGDPRLKVLKELLE